jgi:AcrR family transcriptional regulator
MSILGLRHPTQDQREQLALLLNHLGRAIARDRRAARILLLDVYSAGPAALDLAFEQETGFREALRKCLGRRGRPIHAATAEWVASGAIGLIQRALLGNKDDAALLRNLHEWAEPLLGRPPLPDLSQGPLRRRIGGIQETAKPFNPEPTATFSVQSESSLLLSAFTRLAQSTGRSSHSLARLSKAAGTPASRFKRHFRDPGACAQVGIRAFVTSCFADFVTEARALASVPDVHQAVVTLCGRVADEENLARASFVGITELGLEGLRARDRLCAEVAESWRERLRFGRKPSPTIAWCLIDSLWSTMASGLHTGQAATLRRETATLTFFLATPLIGVGPAAEEFLRISTLRE